MKYIYLIQSLESSYYKIGISQNPTLRLKQLSTGNASELRLIVMYQSEFASIIEKTLQRKYLVNKKNGEWFDLSIKIEVDFVNECKKIEKNIEFLKKFDNQFI